MSTESVKAGSKRPTDDREALRKKQKEEQEAGEKAYAEKLNEFEVKMMNARRKVEFFIPAAANITGKDIDFDETNVTRFTVMHRGIYLYIFSLTNRIAVGIMLEGSFDEMYEPLSFYRFSCHAATVSVVCPKMVNFDAPQGDQWKVEGGEPKVNDNGTWTFDLVWEGFGKQKMSVTIPNPMIE